MVTLEKRCRDRKRVNISSTTTLNPGALEADLKYQVDGEVRFDAGSRAIYSTDASNYRQIPIGVVVPKTTEAVVKTLEICHRHGAPVVSRGGGTGLCGQTCNVAVVIDHSKYLNRILEIDPDRKFARVQPGVILDHLRDQAEKLPPHLRSGPRHPQPQYSRRHDRQQFLRRPFGHGRTYRRERSGTGCGHL